MNTIDFTFSDLVAGYVTRFDWGEGNRFHIRTNTGRETEVVLGDNCFAELVRNLGEPFVDCTARMKDMLAPGRFVYAYGIFYPAPGGLHFEAKHLVFTGRTEREWVFEAQKWWIEQIRQLGDFYLKAQMGDGPPDWRRYRTQLGLGGEHTTDGRQETDTISRLIYGFASAYMLTGDEEFLDAAEAGTEYLREHFRCADASEDTCYWYHAIDLKGDRERKIFASEFGDDLDAIPAYEQIYALAGPTQTFRITGDARIEQDIRMTVNFFQKYLLDRKLGGYFSHLDAITLDPRSEALGRNRARKNWNSVGDHAPAFLINAVLATEDPEWAEMLESCGDTIVRHFPDYSNSPFVNEKFHEDWSPDQAWGWQQNRAVVGHNLKIAWNLTRLYSRWPKPEYEELVRTIGRLMPEHGMDRRRGGWYDVVDRETLPGQVWHGFAWHDRKAWWQQEQGILAYQIMAGVFGDDEYLRLARESAAFYNAWILDHDSGGVYFNVQSNGMPYLLGTERMKGSHSMSGYHSFELCFLAAVYGNLLLNKEHLDLHFRPLPRAFGGLLRVAPDMLPAGSVRIGAVTVDGRPYADFDPEALTVRLPDSDEPLRVVVRILPAVAHEHFASRVERTGDVVRITCEGELDPRAVGQFRRDLAETAGATHLELDLSELTYMCPEGGRALMFAAQKLDLEDRVGILGANAQVAELLGGQGFLEVVELRPPVIA
jgi:mannose/cellobiose epimerase-like protein (N-acyl-D-glucosamine 2-epimerase family)/anti-anti-sigma regulatory factor